MKVATFRAECQSCGNIFAVPLLSEQAYGEFIAKSQSGRAFAYLNSFEEPAWDQLKELCEQLLPSLRSAPARSRAIAVFHYVVGHCLDQTDGETFDIGAGQICPQCHSRDVQYGDSTQIGVLEIPNATFAEFLELDVARRRLRIKELIKSSGL